ncbi:MAG: CotD family spore coat protein [Bacillota bacterium]
MGKSHNSRRNCSCSQGGEETFVHPTRRVVNNRTNERIINNVHPTEIVDVNRTIIQNRNYYPVTRSQVNETFVEDFDCGSDVGSSNNCRRVRGASDNDNDSCHRGCSWI